MSHFNFIERKVNFATAINEDWIRTLTFLRFMLITDFGLSLVMPSKGFKKLQ